VRFLSTLADLDYSWFIFNNLAHCFSSDSPYLGELRNSVVLLDESLIVEEAIAVNRLPEVRRISNRLASNVSMLMVTSFFEFVSVQTETWFLTPNRNLSLAAVWIFVTHK